MKRFSLTGDSMELQRADQLEAAKSYNSSEELSISVFTAVRFSKLRRKPKGRTLAVARSPTYIPYPGGRVLHEDAAYVVYSCQFGFEPKGAAQ